MPRIRKSTGIIEVIAWIAGGALLTVYATARWHFHESRAAGLREFAAAVDDAGSPRPSGTASAPGNDSEKSVSMPTVSDDSTYKREITLLRDMPAPDMSSWSQGRVAAYQREAGPSTPQAVLRIGAIDLEVPVYAGVRESNLNRGAAWIDGTAPLGQSGNAGLAAHRDGYFRALRHISIGDRIEVQTLQRSTTYVVEEILIVDPKDVAVLAPSNESRLTLVTCYPFYMIGPAPKRFIVRALAADTRMSAPAPS
jgi:sortase A